MRPRVKICGLTEPDQVEQALRCGADFIGLNFYPPSPRYVSVERARELRGVVGARARVVGVFVDAPAQQVDLIASRVGLDLLQFHGDESREEIAPFASRAIKVLRAKGDIDERQLAQYADVWGLLFDTPGVPGRGGSGEAWRWHDVARVHISKPVFVAGGIRPDNVGELLARFQPWGLDVCSGVESAPGQKDAALLQRLFEEIDHAQAQLTT